MPPESRAGLAQSRPQSRGSHCFMPTHRTYADHGEGDDLQQGDILKPTEALSGVFRKVHPYFLDAKYSAFIVLTQSCDLERRPSHCKAEHISVAVVRPLWQVLAALLDCVCDKVAERVYLQESKAEAKKLLTRVFNQNEQALGLFYLHEDHEVGIGEASVALLRVSIALRREHYDVIRDARRGRLQVAFQHKLGWLVGNLYSRIGTGDWGKKDLRRMIAEQLDPADPNGWPRWVKRVCAQAARDRGVDIGVIAAEDVCSELSKYEPPSPRDQALEAVYAVLRKLDPPIPGETIETVCKRLQNDGAFARALRAVAAESPVD